MKQVSSRLKPLLRWAILGGTLFFLTTVLKHNWQRVAEIRITGAGLACLTVALGITLLAHICAGWVWSFMLQDFQQPVHGIVAIQAYLKTTIAKYLPGNVWHYYGRITAATDAGATSGAAIVSVLLEPILMAAAALVLALLCSQQIGVRYGLTVLGLQWAILLGILLLLHPRVLNPLIHRLHQLKLPTASPHSPITSPLHPRLSSSPSFQLDHYPLLPLLGELSFLLLRGLGFLLTVLAVSPIQVTQMPILLSAFSFAWLLGLVVPGAPGGLGVFETAAIALLGPVLSPAILLSAAALYRLISVLAEATGAGLAWLEE
jgi:uncharacterized membrane protein YbhN (UPF0104 family)